jgi:nitrate reductase delta subunit
VSPEETGRGYDLLAELLEYPGVGVLAVAERCRTLFATRCPEASAEVESFEAYVAGVEEHELEELYARTFDFNPPAALDLGYQLFGESYKRGIFLVKMQREVNEHGVDRRSELPDHLPVVLRLIARLREEEDPRSLVDEVVLPTTLKVLSTFADKSNPY